MKVWKHRTTSGRVVYDRPKHKFDRKDIDRIIGRVDPGGFYMSSKEYENLMGTLDYIATANERLLKGLLGATDIKDPVDQVDVIDKLEEMIEAMRDPWGKGIPYLIETVEQIRALLRKQGGPIG